MSLTKFLVKLAAGITGIVLSTLSFGLGVLRESTLFLVFGACAMVLGVIAMVLSSQDLRSPDFLQRLVMRSMKKSRWTNTLCPTCFWWMRDEYDAGGVRVWHCINPNHEHTKPL